MTTDALARTLIEVQGELEDANQTIERLRIERDEAVAANERIRDWVNKAFDRRAL